MTRQQAARAFIVAVLTGWALTHAAAAAAQNNLGTIRGRVVDDKGKAVAGAEVQLDFAGDIQRTFKVKTDSKGDFTQTGMPVGNWNIKVTKGNLSAQLTGQHVPLNDVYTIRPDIVLKPEKAAGPGDVASANAKLVAEMQAKFKTAVEAIDAAKYDEAIGLLQEISKVNEKCATCRARLGEAYFKKSVADTDAAMKKADLEAAEAAYKNAIEVDPTQPDSYAGLATLYNAQQKFEDATKMSNKAMELMAAAPGGGDPAVVFNQGIIFWNQGKFDEARQMFQKATETDPKMADAHYWLGMALVHDGKLPEAKKELEEYLKLAPTGDNAATAKAIIAQIKI